MKKLFKYLFRLLGLLIVVILIVGFCFEKKVPSSWCEGKFDGLTQKLEISNMEDIEKYPYKKVSSKTIEASYNQNKKIIDKETTCSIVKNVDKDGTFVMKVTVLTKTNTTSGSKTSEEKYTYEKKDGKFYYAVNEETLSEKSEAIWNLEVYAYFYSATPLNLLSGKFEEYDTIKSHVTKYTQKGINIFMHSQNANEEYVLAKVIGMKEISSYKKTTFTYQDNVLKNTTEVSYSFKKK